MFFIAPSFFPIILMYNAFPLNEEGIAGDVMIIKEGCIRFNKSDLVNFCYGILNAAGYGIYFNFKANGGH